MQVFEKTCKFEPESEENQNPEVKKKCKDCSRDQQISCWGFTED